MHQPSNPFSFWVNGNETKEFIYEAGSIPYYVWLKQRSTIYFSVVIFADSVEHVKDILTKAIHFQFECAGIYSKNTNTVRRLSGNWDTLGKALSESYEEADNLHIQEVNKSQALKVSWACNDTIQ